jgi:hypothetical protein
VEIHGAEEIERDILCSSKKIFFCSGQRRSHIRKCCELISRCVVKDLSHSPSYFSFVARSWRMNMYEDVIGTDMMPTFLKIMGQMVQNWLIDCGESADRLGVQTLRPHHI